MNGTRLALILAAALASPACTTVQDKIGYYKGNIPDLDAEDVAGFVAAQDEVVRRLKLLSGTDPQKDGDDWRPVVDAGILYSDVRCDRFMDALFWANRVRETTSREIGFASSAASAAMALFNASKDLIGLTPLGFALADQTINNIGEGLLFDLSPSIVRSLVEKQQTAYLQGLNGTRFTTKTGAMQAIQTYTAICLPPSIETEVSRAVEASEYKPIDYFGRNEPAPAVGEKDAAPAPPPPLSPPPPSPTQPSPDATPVLGRTPGA